MKLVLRPDEIQSPIGKTCPFCGTLGRTEYELIAAHIICRSQKAGKWVGWKYNSATQEDVGMIEAGFAKETPQGLLKLTNKAKLLLHEKYPTSKKTHHVAQQ